MTVPWYRGFQFRTLLLLLFFLVPPLFFTYSYGYFASFRSLLRGLVDRTELLLETQLFGLDNLLRVQANLLTQETQSTLFLKNLFLLLEVRGDPLRYDAIRTHFIAEFMDDFGLQREVPLWMQDVILVDTRGRVWVSTQKRHEGVILSPALLERLRQFKGQDQTAVFLWGREPALGYDWAWIGLVRYVQDSGGHGWWVLGLIPPESLSVWLENLFALQGIPFVTTPQEAFGVTVDGHRTVLPDEELQLVTSPPPRVYSWNTLTWFVLQGTPVHLQLDPSPHMPEVLYIAERHPHMVVFHPREQGQLWVVYPRFLGSEAQIGVKFSLSETLYTTTRFIGRYLTIHVLVLLGLATLVGWWFSGRVARPVREIIDSVQAFSKGRWDVRVPVKGRDEFALLAQVLNQMASSLERLYRSLEEEVRRRTYQVRLFLDWLAEAPPEDAPSFRNFLERVLRGLRPFLPQSVYPVLALWNDDRHGIDWRVTVVVEDEESAPPRTPAERHWVQEVLRQRRPALYTQETHRGQIPHPYKAVWIQPLFQQNRAVGALLFYSTQDQTFDEPFQNHVQDLAPTVSSAVTFAHLAWVRTYLHQIVKDAIRLLQSVAADLMGIFFAVARFLERDFPQSILLVRVPETENQWQPLYPATLAGRSLRLLFPINRGQRWLLESDLEALRAVQRLPREVRDLAQEQGWSGVVVFPLWTQQRLEAVLLLGLEEPGEYPPEILDALSLVMHILAQLLERSDVQEHVRLWQTVMEFFLASAEAPTLGQALATLVRSARRLFMEEGDYFFVFVDEEGDIKQSFVFLEGQEQHHVILAPVEQALVQKVVEEQQPLLFSEPREMFTRLGEPSHLAGSSFPQSWMGLPFMLGSRVLGVWGLRDMHQVHRFDRMLMHRLWVFTERLAPAMYYLIRMQHYEHRLQREEWIHALGTHLVTLWDPSVLTQETAGEIMRIFQARRVTFRLHMPTVSEATATRAREALRDKTPGEAT